MTLKHHCTHRGPVHTDVAQPVVNQGMKLALFEPTFSFGYYLSLGKRLTGRNHNLVGRRLFAHRPQVKFCPKILIYETLGESDHHIFIAVAGDKCISAKCYWKVLPSFPWQQKEAMNALNHGKYLEYERQMVATSSSSCRTANILQGSPKVCGELWCRFFLLPEESMEPPLVYQSLARNHHYRA